MVKNSLGAQFGGVTGALLFLSNTFGVAMYVLGCVEVLQLSFPATFGDLPMRVLGAIILTGLAVIVFVGVEYVCSSLQGRARWNITFTQIKHEMLPLLGGRVC